MIPRLVHLLPLALVLAACTGERVRTQGSILADSDRPTVGPAQSGPMPMEEAPPFPVDPNRPAAMAADNEPRAPAAPAPTSILEEPKPR
jgi:hypothetical protein